MIFTIDRICQCLKRLYQGDRANRRVPFGFNEVKNSVTDTV